MSDILARLLALLRAVLVGESSPRGPESRLVAATPIPLLPPRVGGAATVSAPGPRDAEAPEPRSPRFVLQVDDAGQYLVACAPSITIGHLRAGRADLLFLADVSSVHARLTRRDSLRDGVVWSIEATGPDAVRVGDVQLAGEPARLTDGLVVSLGENLAFRFRLPDPASHSAVLELLRGAECVGAERVILLGEGEGGRLRIGAADLRHVQVAGLEHEIELVRAADELEVRCAAGVHSDEPARRETFRLPFPPRKRHDLSVGRAEGARGPFGLALTPLDPVEGENA